MNETYHYGQGKVELAEILPNGQLGPWVWIGDVSELTASLTQEEFTHQESYSGKKASVRKIFTSTTFELSATLHELGADNIARFTLGTTNSEDSGTVTGEDLGTIAPDDVVQLDEMGVSNLVITDSTSPSAATIDPSHYEYDAFGEIVFNSLPSDPAPTQPLLASYSHTARNQVAFLTAARKDYALRYKGINLAEGDKPVLMELYKVSPGLMQTLSMITNGQQLAAAPVTFEALLDTSKSPTDSLGQYGRIVTLGY